MSSKNKDKKTYNITQASSYKNIDDTALDEAFNNFLKKSNIRIAPNKKSYVSVDTPIVTFEKSKTSLIERSEKYMNMKYSTDLISPKNKFYKNKFKTNNFQHEIKPFIKPNQYIDNRMVQECIPMDLVYIDEHTCRFNMEKANSKEITKEVHALDLYSLDLHAHCVESARTKMMYLFKIASEKRLSCLMLITGQGPTLKGAVEKLLTQSPFVQHIKNVRYITGKFIINLR